MSNIQKSNQNTASLSLKDKLNKLAISARGKESALAKVELPRLFYQLVIFVLDSSGSMGETGKTGKSKGEEVSDIIIPVINRLKESRNHNCFDISTFVYAENYEKTIDTMSVDTISSEHSFNPNDYEVGHLTYIAECLKDIQKHSLQYLQQHSGRNAQVLIIVLSDGHIFDIEEAAPIAKSLAKNSKVTISSAFLETQGIEKDHLVNCQNNMRYITSTSNLGVDHFFTSTVDPDAIRKHMIKSISTVSKID